MVGIYKITSPVGKIYIGQTTDIKNRFKMYRRLNCKSQVKVYNSLVKYGIENHIFEIICECKMEELDELEIAYIKQFNSFNNINGLNLRAGGGCGGSLSEETRKRQSESHKGKKHTEEQTAKIRLANIGRKRSEASRKKMSLASLGKKKSEIHREKIIKMLTGRVFSKEHKDKISKSLIGNRRGAYAKGEKHHLYGKRGVLCPLYGRKISKDILIKREEAKRIIRQERLTMIF